MRLMQHQLANIARSTTVRSEKMANWKQATMHLPAPLQEQLSDLTTFEISATKFAARAASEHCGSACGCGLEASTGLHVAGNQKQ
jgi:hypothetical protein